MARKLIFFIILSGGYFKIFYILLKFLGKISIDWPLCRKDWKNWIDLFHHIPPPHLYVNPWILFWQLGPNLGGWIGCNKSTDRVNFDLQSFELEVEVSIWSTHYKLTGELSDILCCITQLITGLSSQKFRIARLSSIFKEKGWTWHWHWHWLRLFKSLDGFAFYF